MNELRAHFPNLPDVVLMNYLAMSNSDIGRCTQLLNNAIANGNPNLQIYQPQILIPNPQIPPKTVYQHDVPIQNQNPPQNYPIIIHHPQIQNQKPTIQHQPVRRIKITNPKPKQEVILGSSSDSDIEFEAAPPNPNPFFLLNINQPQMPVQRIPIFPQPRQINPIREDPNLQLQIRLQQLEQRFLEQQQYFQRISQIEIRPPLKLPQRKTEVMGITFTLPVIPEKAIKLITDSLRVSPEMDFARASSFLELVIQTDKYPDDIIDRLLLAASDTRQAPSPSFAKDYSIVLQNLFPKITQANLKRIFFANGKRLLTTIDSLQKNPPNAIMKTPRKPVSEIVISDLFVAYDIIQIENREQTKKQEEEKRLQEEKEIEEARANGSLIECSCCFCEVPIDKCLQCPEGHLFCRDCVMKMIETTIAEGRSSVKCPAMDGCGMDIPMSELERTMPEKTLERLFQTEAINDVTKSGLDHLVTCSNCGFIVQFLGSGNMKCPQCGKETCSKCGCPAHRGKTCEEAKAMDPDKIIEEKMNDAIIRVCPNCHTPFMKDEGCNKMVCPRCDTWICYWCRKVIPKEVGYDHFWRQPGPCPPDKCPLWVENKQLHIIEAAKAKIDATDEIKKEEQKD